MKAIKKEMSMEELGAFVYSALEKEGIETVLSGGCLDYNFILLRLFECAYSIEEEKKVIEYYFSK